MKTKLLNSKMIIPSAIVIVLLLVMYVIKVQTTSSYPSITRSLSSDSQMNMVWEKQIALRCDLVTDNNFVFVCTGDSALIAIDKINGSVVWENKLITGEAVRSLLVNNQMLIAITTLNAYAFNTSNGNYLWSVKLGDGHVGIMAQLDGQELRIYYGDNIIEIDPSTGQITRTISRNSILWINENVEIHQINTKPSTSLTAFDRMSGMELWTSPGPVFLSTEGLSPRSFDLDSLIVFSGSHICNLDVSIGKYLWCTPGSYISNIAIDDKNGIGYMLNKNFSLLLLDLRTGKILHEIQFLPIKLPDTLSNRWFSYSISISGDTIIISFGDSHQLFGIKTK